ncbi:MAG: membrane protein insertion efficiency factor YidD [Candidatus Endonucleobacter sp. (ex Gigantidas childressi)]|nr:membrane protein insertion efficiency factor YidD [Candidatus Endonucleobacter sp. (ex Gigantidas childressi)]
MLRGWFSANIFPPENSYVVEVVSYTAWRWIVGVLNSLLTPNLKPLAIYSDSISTGIMMAKFSTLPKFCVVGLIKLYCYCISPLIAGRCRFYPTCSVFAVGAIERYGLMRGLFLTGKRLLCCQPWHSGGFYPIPEFPPSATVRKSHINPYTIGL